MGTIISPVDEVDKVYWTRPKAGRAVKAVSVVIVPKDGPSGDDLMVVKLADGTFACSKDLSKSAYLPGRWPWQGPVMRALVAIGAISEKARQTHLEHCERVSSERNKRYKAENLRDNLADLGLTATPEQQAVIDTYARDKK